MVETTRFAPIYRFVESDKDLLIIFTDYWVSLNTLNVKCIRGILEYIEIANDE